MRAYVPAYQLHRVTTLEAALARLSAEAGKLKPLAGGTDLMVLLGAGKLPTGDYLDISHLRELEGIEVEEGSVRLGALTTYADMMAHPVLQREFPNLVQAARDTGAAAIQNRGTLGGNIANASPAADTPPALLVYGAEIELISQRGTRRLDYSTFHLGYKQTQMAPDELIAGVILARAGLNFHSYRKVGTRKAQAISKVCIAASARREGDQIRELKVAYGAVAPTPVLCPRAAAALVGGDASLERAQTLLLEEIAPIDDIRSTRIYRQRVAANLLEELWQALRA